MPDREPPYFEWPLDRWKLLVLVLLFVLLLLGALFWPAELLTAIPAQLATTLLFRTRPW